MFKTIRIPFFNADDAGGAGGSDQTFTQADIDRIVSERLARERASKVDYDDLKEVAELVKEFGYAGTPAEIKAALKAEAEERRKAAELKDLEEEAATSGTSPELLAEIKELKKELAEIKKEKDDAKKQQEAKTKADEAWQKQVEQFQEKHPDVNMEKLSENKKFVDFVQKANPNLTFLEVYETYIDLVGGAERAAIEKIASNAERSTFSGKAKGSPDGGNYGLNDHQLGLAKSAGMSPKEYAELLAHVKK